jgi:hypothetical protein
MARPTREQSDPRVIRDWIKEGRGTGHNGTWQPWLRIQDLSSTGKAGRLSRHISGDRLVHVLSGYETHCFDIFEWAPGIIDINEQYLLLPLEETQEIARELGVDHPVSPNTGDPIVMSTDFMLTQQNTESPKEYFPRDFKPAQRLFSPKTLAKFEITKRYHKNHGRDWRLITDHNFPIELARNLSFLRDKRSLDGLKGITPEVIENVRQVLLPLIWKGNSSLSSAGLHCDRQLGLDELGTSLNVAYHFIYTRQWIVDLTHRLRAGLPLILLSPQPI